MGSAMREYGSRIRGIILSALEDFNKNGINYCILRNYEFLLEESEKQERDVDVLISSGDVERASEILRKHGFLERRRGCTTNHLGYPRVVLKLGSEERRVGFDFHVDGLAYNGCYYLLSKDVLARKKCIYINASKKIFFYVPSNEDYFLELLLHSILDKGEFRDKYKEILEELSDDKGLDISYMKNITSELFGKKLSNKLIELALNRRYDDLLKLKWDLVLALCMNKPANTLILIRNLLRIRKINIINVMNKAYKLMNPFYKAPMISFIGVDGSGKTTIANELNKVLNDLGFNSKVFYLGIHKPAPPVRVILKIYNVLQRKKKFGNRKLSSRKKKIIKISNISKFFKIFLRLLDLYIRYTRVVIMRKRGIVAITDRFFHDLILYSDVDKAVLSFLLKIFPKPDYLFYLYNDPRVIHKRGKDNLSIDDIKRQMEKIESFKELFDYIPIRSDGIENAVTKILKHIVIII